MTTAFLAASAAYALSLVCITGALTRLMSKERRAFARERDLLLAQLLHVVGKPWTPAPASEPKPEREPGPPRFTATPERFPEE